MISRRDLVLGAGALAASARLVLAETLGGFQVIRARKVHGALMGPQNPGTDLWAFSDAWPPPVLRAKQGEQLKTRFVNELDRLISIHWFGIRGPTDLMSLAVEPGEENAIDCSFAPPILERYASGRLLSRHRVDLGLAWPRAKVTMS